MKKTLWVAWVMVGLGTGCAGIRAAQARQAYLQSQTENVVISRPLEQVWPEVQQLLFLEGFELKNSGMLSGFSTETEDRYEKSTDGSSATRYLVQGTSVGTGCRVTFIKLVELVSSTGTHSRTTGRDFDLEFRLLQQADPAKAAELERGAEERAQAAANAG